MKIGNNIETSAPRGATAAQRANSYNGQENRRTSDFERSLHPEEIIDELNSILLALPRNLTLKMLFYETYIL